ncbi:cell division control protein 45 homolog isoform X2 [Ctenocephalides felis]|uniref:cell division control protein 45 homolog isoform X2 n=1 Tax=Ctenocephalides felis TaxID=7515 RepID=UPI000E6E1FE4|nr:cell division control protein 45 homolog isoform X2 [Ctenocephalides felis]
MYTQNIIQDFYKSLIGKRILLIVNYDVDAICACKILQTLFKYDNTLYTLCPVLGIEDLKRAYAENCDEIKYIILLNCGGSVDIVDLLQLPDDVIVYILDSHRPIDICNIYSSGQIRILGKPESNIPAFEEIFRDDESDEDDQNDDDSESEEGMSRTELAEQRILKRREKRLWEEKRNKIMFDYTQFSYYGPSSAIILFELAWKLSKDSMELLWWAIIGATEQLIMDKVETSQYTLDTEVLHSHVSRLIHRANDQQMQSSLKISFERDLRLALYRHWSVEASLRHSIYTACKLKLWTLRGEKKMQELLAEMGLPLVQARQTFSSMDLTLRKEFHSMIEKLAEKYDLKDLVYASFTMQYGYRNKYCASDIVYTMLSILESTSKERSRETCFLDAMDCLSRSQRGLLENGIEQAKKMLTVIFRQTQTTLETHQVMSAGPFLYLILDEESPYFSNPYGLIMLAQFALRGHVAVSRSRRANALPLIACAPLQLLYGMCLMVGLPPVCEDSPKNFFGKAFEQAAHKSQILAFSDFFDTSIVKIKYSDRTKFLDALTALLS